MLGWDEVELRYFSCPQWTLEFSSNGGPDLPEVLSRFVVYKNKKADTQSVKHVFIVLLDSKYGSSNESQ